MAMDQRPTTLVLIPAYKPDARLLPLCAELRAAGLSVLVVDDGGGADYRHYFDEAQALGCHIERHAVNLGKGRALKTGINAALNHYENLTGIVTADADGQHTCADIQRIVQAMDEYPGELIMGSRALVGDVPFKSRAGNAITRYVYRFVTGIRCHDTQTGLRGIPAASLEEMLRMPGERYEYEMTMLLKLRDMDMQLHEVSIETIYFDDNKGSHFHPVRDAARIYSVILRFLCSSVLSFALDYALYLLGLRFSGWPPWVCYAVARVISSLFNYTVNRLAVFGGRGGKTSLFRYYLLAVTQMAVGAGLVEFLHTALGIGAGFIKIPVDILLFLLSYVIQRDFVFGNRWSRKRGKQA